MKKIFVFVLLYQILLTDSYALTLGVVPQQSPFKLIKTWTPIVQYLQKATGEKVELKVEHSIPKFEQVLYSGGYDIAYMNPYHYILAHKKEGYVAKVRADKEIVGILVVRKDSGIKNIEMTKGKKFLFPAPNAFAATLLTKYELLKYYGIDIAADNNFLYVNSHDSVYKGVARKVGDVGGGIERTLHNLNDAESKNDLKVLYRTKEYPSHPFAFKSSLNKELSKRLEDALLHMPKALLKGLSVHKMIKTDDAEYDSVRDIAKKLKLKNGAQ